MKANQLEKNTNELPADHAKVHRTGRWFSEDQCMKRWQAGAAPQ